VILGAQGLDSMESFCAAELDELFKGLDQMLQSSPPLETPAAIPIGQLGRIVVTLKRYRDVCAAAIESLEVKEDGETDEDLLASRGLARFNEMKGLLEVDPPKAPPLILMP